MVVDPIQYVAQDVETEVFDSNAQSGTLVSSGITTRRTCERGSIGVFIWREWHIPSHYTFVRQGDLRESLFRPVGAMAPLVSRKALTHIHPLLTLRGLRGRVHRECMCCRYVLSCVRTTRLW